MFQKEGYNSGGMPFQSVDLPFFMLTRAFSNFTNEIGTLRFLNLGLVGNLRSQIILFKKK